MLIYALVTSTKTPGKMEYLILTVQAPQTADIWLKITRLVSEMECHISQAQGHRLASESAMIAMVCGNWNTIAKLETGLKRLSNEEGITIHSKRSKLLENTPQLLPYFVEILGLDDKTILSNLCEFFSEENIVIENLYLESYVSSATNTPMFSLKVSIGIPSDSNIGELRERFILFCEELNIDGAIEPDKR